MPEKLSENERSRVMSLIRSKNTKCELKLRSALRALGLRGYRLNYRGLPGTPDIVFTKQKVTIFCDSDFWHGKKGLPEKNQEYWKEKLRKNAERDVIVNKKLEEQDWIVLRFSESQILNKPDDCARQIQSVLSNYR